MTIAFITGITGQDGSYLTELLLDKGYTVHGLVRRNSTLERSRLEHLYRDESIYERRLFLHYADLSDFATIQRLVAKIEPAEFYHLAGQSHVGLSFEIPESTCDLTGMGTLRIMEVLRNLPRPPRFLHASSREIFGAPPVCPQDETTPMNPNSPYGCAKAFATQLAKVYRESYGLFFCNAICYNHESPRRGENFVTRKISLAAARIKCGLQDKLVLGDVKATRDWGYAKDYVDAMWRMLQQTEPDDYVIATGQSHSIEEFLDLAFGEVGLDWRDHVDIDPRYFRPSEPTLLIGNAAKARTKLGWVASTDLRELARIMVAHDLEVALEEQKDPRAERRRDAKRSG